MTNAAPSRRRTAANLTTKGPTAGPTMEERMPQRSTPAPVAGHDQWLTVWEAAAVLGRPPRAVRFLVATGHVRRHKPPGLAARYYKPDLERLSPAAAAMG